MHFIYKKLLSCFVLFQLLFQLISISNAQIASGYNERIEQQELEIRRLTGEIETLKYKNQNLEIKLNGLRKEMELRLQDLESSTSTLSSDKTKETNQSSEGDAISKILSPTHETTIGTASVLYDAAQANLQRKDYTSAAAGFDRIIKEYPQHNLAPNAYYWLGETYYARKEYDKAALTFLEGKRKFPNSSKAGHSLLKLGLSLHFLKQDRDACLTFDEVEKNYLNKDKSLESPLVSSRFKVGCQ